MEIQLSWIEPITGEHRQPMLQTPIALGKEFALMPQVLEGNRVTRIVLKDNQIADYDALIDVENGDLIVVAQSNSSGIKVNEVELPSSQLRNGDRLQIGYYELTIMINTVAEPIDAAKCDRMVGFLFKRKCERTSRIGCPDCGGSDNDDTPYFYQEYDYYPGYSSYRRDSWGHSYYENRDAYSYDPETGNVDFTEADNASMEMEADEGFELDMGES